MAKWIFLLLALLIVFWAISSDDGRTIEEMESQTDDDLATAGLIVVGSAVCDLTISEYGQEFVDNSKKLMAAREAYAERMAKYVDDYQFLVSTKGENSFCEMVRSDMKKAYVFD